MDVHRFFPEGPPARFNPAPSSISVHDVPIAVAHGGRSNDDAAHVGRRREASSHSLPPVNDARSSVGRRRTGTAPVPFGRKWRRPSRRVDTGGAGRHEVRNAVVIPGRHRDGLQAYEGRAPGGTPEQGAPASVPAVRWRTRSATAHIGARGKHPRRESERHCRSDFGNAAIHRRLRVELENGGGELRSGSSAIGVARG